MLTVCIEEGMSGHTIRMALILQAHKTSSTAFEAASPEHWVA